MYCVWFIMFVGTLVTSVNLICWGVKLVIPRERAKFFKFLNHTDLEKGDVDFVPDPDAVLKLRLIAKFGGQTLAVDVVQEMLTENEVVTVEQYE